jgi:pyruvate carboxylase
MITGIDIVQTQIKVAEGYALDSDEIGIKSQDDVRCLGDAIQCRITTEDPMNNFMPDSGKIIVYRSGGGFGVRLDSGNAFAGAIITPYYDSLLVKATTYGLNHEAGCTEDAPRPQGIPYPRRQDQYRLPHQRLEAAVVRQAGDYNVNFIDEHPELFNLPVVQDRGTKLLKYIGDTTINGYANAGPQEKPEFERLELPQRLLMARILMGRNSSLIPWDRKNSPSGSSTRRKSSLPIRLCVMPTSLCWRRGSAPSICSASWKRLPRKLPEFFSYECWGGATFRRSLPLPL